MKLIIAVVLLLLFSGYTVLVYIKGTRARYVDLTNREEISEGKLLWQQKNCSSCHQIYGLGGYLGPELTYEISQPGKGVPYVKSVLHTGLNKMPDFHFSAQEINSLTAFLVYIDSTARKKPH